MFAASQYAASIRCLVVELERNSMRRRSSWTRKIVSKKHRTEWNAVASKCRFMRYGKDEGIRKMCRPKMVGEELQTQAEKMETTHLGFETQATWLRAS